MVVDIEKIRKSANIIGSSDKMNEMLFMIGQVANTDISVASIDCCATNDEICCIRSKPYPAEYVISFDEGSYPVLRGNLPDIIEDTQMTNFNIYDTQNDRPVPYIFLEQEGFENYTLDFGDQIYLYDKLDDITNQLSWALSFFDPSFSYDLNDSLLISTSKPFNSGDVFYFKTSEPFIDNELGSYELSNIKVVPNPYIAATKFESPLPPGVTSGRGERKIEFQNLPYDASVKIFTSRGQHIETLYHNGNIHSGTISWDLKTKENKHKIHLGTLKKTSSKTQSLSQILNKVRKKIDFMKIDVDGYEINVLRSGKKIINKYKPIIYFEFAPYLYKEFGYSPKILIDFIKKELNYTFLNENFNEVQNINEISENLKDRSVNFFLAHKKNLSKFKNL